jgi:hypothetical protein
MGTKFHYSGKQERLFPFPKDVAIGPSLGATNPLYIRTICRTFQCYSPVYARVSKVASRDSSLVLVTRLQVGRPKKLSIPDSSKGRFLFSKASKPFPGPAQHPNEYPSSLPRGQICALMNRNFRQPKFSRFRMT